MYILDHWPDYFEKRDEGLGTTYERFILHRHFEALRDEFEITSVLECPTFGMTGVSGINSMWWAANGVPVTLVDHDRDRLALTEEVWREVDLPIRAVTTDPLFRALPLADGSSDLAWSFAALQFLPETGPLLAELTRAARKAVVICVPNRSNPLVAMRIRLERNLAGLHSGNARAGEVVRTMAGLGWTVRRQLTFDAPPWPDIAMSKEELLRRVGLGMVAKRLSRKSGPPLCIVDHFAGQADSMEETVLRFDWFEGLPEMLRRLWAHHQLILFTPADAGQGPSEGS